MAKEGGNRGKLGRRGRRIAAWCGVTALVLLVPLAAMQFTGEVNWDETDFLFAGALILGVGLAYEFAAGWHGDAGYRAAVGFALAGAFLLVWTNAAVGIVGSEANPFNRIYFAVLAVGLLGTVLARLRPAGMARAMVATALALALVGALALIVGEHRSAVSSVAEIVAATGFLAMPWLISAWLFSRAARPERPAG